MTTNILYIDDSRDALEFLEELLTNEGFNVILCEQSQQTFELLEKYSIDCIITDLKMPFLEGEDLINILRRKYPHIPIIVMSAHVESEQALKENGVYAVLPKPVQTDIIITTIRNCIAAYAGKIIFSYNHLNLLKIRDDMYRRLIITALEKTNGNKVNASKLIGISRNTLTRYIKRYNIPSETE